MVFLKKVCIFVLLIKQINDLSIFHNKTYRFIIKNICACLNMSEYKDFFKKKDRKWPFWTILHCTKWRPLPGYHDNGTLQIYFYFEEYIFIFKCMYDFKCFKWGQNMALTLPTPLFLFAMKI